MTIREIAKLMGVSPSTVSVVLNNRTGVRKELRDQIAEILISNGYTIKNTPSTNGTILFAYYQSTNYLSLRKDDVLILTLNEVQQTCQNENYNFLFKNVNHDNIDQIFKKSSLEGIDGIVLLGTEYYHKPGQYFFDPPVPLVILDGFFPEYPVNTVNIDNYAGIHQIVQHLVQNGHKNIGYIKSKIEFGCLRDRKNAIYSSFEQFGLHLNPDHIIHVSAEAEKVQDEVTDYLQHASNLPTAFIADNDFIAVSALQAFQQNGLRIPNDISLTGFDNSDIGTIISPHLTTVQSDFKGMAKLATKRIIDLIARPEPSIIKSTVGVTLVERQTVAPLQ